MTSTIKSLIRSAGMQVCPACSGEGEVGYFCGHEITTDCIMCNGHGVVRSLKKQNHLKPCEICEGRGGGCCDKKGYQKWETYELFTPSGYESRA